MPVGALLAGAVVSLAEPSFGRELALRVPYAMAGAMAIVLAVYGFARLRL